MSYNNAIPTATQRLKDSQPQLLENFKTISALLGIDHVISPWTDPATGNQGKHNQVTLPEQAAAPTTAANEMMIYTKEVSGATQLFIQNEGGGTEVNITSAGKTTDGWARLPSGILIKWGYVAGTGNRDSIQTTYMFPSGSGEPAFSSIYSVIIGSTNRRSGDNTAKRQLTVLRSFTVSQIIAENYGLVSAEGTASDWTYFAIGI